MFRKVSFSKSSILSKEYDTGELGLSHQKTCFTNIWQIGCYSFNFRSALGEVCAGSTVVWLALPLLAAGHCKVQLRVKTSGKQK